MEGVDESQQCGVRNWVLHASGFGATLKVGCVVLEAWKYICRVKVFSAQLPAERQEGEDMQERTSGENLGEEWWQSTEWSPQPPCCNKAWRSHVVMEQGLVSGEELHCGGA